MPPKQVAAPAPLPSPSPPPTASASAGNSDAQDMLVLQDLMDTLDQLPPELTRVYADLNELGAVLYTTLLQLQSKLNQLIDWVQDTSIGPEQRFQLLQEIAEEAARYKLGADDKIRVAGGASEGIMMHQRHITNLLSASTLLNSAPPSPYTQALTLSSLPIQSTSRRGQFSRAANSPFGGRGYAAAANGSAGPGGAGPSGDGRVGDTPTKKKKSRVQQLGQEDDEGSVSGRERKAPGGNKKRKPTNRAVSPADSLGSTSAFAPAKPVEPRTARQIAAAAARARAKERDDDSDDSDAPRGKGGIGMAITPSSDSMMDRGGLGLDFGGAGGHSRESTMGRSANATPVLGHASVLAKEAGRARPRSGAGGAGGNKRTRQDEEDEGESEVDDDDRAVGAVGAGPPGGASKKGNGTGSTGTGGGNVANIGRIMPPGGSGPHDLDPEGMEGDADGAIYCTCRQVGFGEMIGCDDADCEIEWYHIACLGFTAPPEGNWICPQCVERTKRNPKAKKPAKPRRAK